MQCTSMLRRVLAGTAAALAAWMAPLRAGAQPAAATPPNIVVLFADDLGYGDLSSYGHPTILTPNLDGMAAEGIRLTSFYAGAPVCTPSRAALLTGRYPIRVGLPRVLGPSSTHGLPDEEVTMAEALRARGYRTAAIGKWHLGHLPRYLPTNHGFDSYFGIPFSNDMMRPWVPEATEKVPLMRGTEVVERPVDQNTLTRRYTEEAIQVMREAGGRPFFVYLAYAMPHLPIFASDAFRGRSRAGLYGDVIEEIDWSAGEILRTLRELGVDGNTIVVFTSDNGPWLNLPARMLQGGVRPWHSGWSGHLRGSKATTYEGGMRVPGIMRWPGTIPARQVSAEPATAMDLYVTLLRAAGAALPADRPLDGRDLLSMLAARAPSPTEEVFYFDAETLEAVRRGRWKVRVSRAADDQTRLPAPAVELFDLEVDPGERFNVAEEHPGIVRELSQRLRAFAGEVGARVAELSGSR
jgi:arylsulfatase A